MASSSGSMSPTRPPPSPTFSTASTISMTPSEEKSIARAPLQKLRRVNYPSFRNPSDPSGRRDGAQFQCEFLPGHVITAHEAELAVSAVMNPPPSPPPESEDESNSDSDRSDPGARYLFRNQTRYVEYPSGRVMVTAEGARTAATVAAAAEEKAAVQAKRGRGRPRKRPHPGVPAPAAPARVVVEQAAVVEVSGDANDLNARRLAKFHSLPRNSKAEFLLYANSLEPGALGILLRPGATEKDAEVDLRMLKKTTIIQIDGWLDARIGQSAGVE